MESVVTRIGVRSMEDTEPTEDWRACWDRWANRFYLFARQQARSDMDAQDVLQEAMVKVWRQTGGVFDNPGAVFRQIRRSAIDLWRREERRRRREEEFSELHDGGSWFPGAKVGTMMDLEAALRGLRPEQQEVLVLKIWCDQSFAQIGEALELSPNTVASRYRYGLENLKKVLAEDVHS